MLARADYDRVVGTAATTASLCPQPGTPPQAGVSLRTIAREWGRIGCIGFGRPPAHITLFRELCVTRREWRPRISSSARSRRPTCCRTGLDTVRGSTAPGGCTAPGALIGGLGFILPGAGGDPRALRAVPRGIAARVDSGRRDGSRSSSRRRRDQGRAGRGRANLETRRAAAAPHPPLRARGRGRGGHDGSVARTHPAGVRCD